VVVEVEGVLVDEEEEGEGDEVVVEEEEERTWATSFEPAPESVNVGRIVHDFYHNQVNHNDIHQSSQSQSQSPIKSIKSITITHHYSHHQSKIRHLRGVEGRRRARRRDRDCLNGAIGGCAKHNSASYIISRSKLLSHRIIKL